jgi:hypothetical protein
MRGQFNAALSRKRIPGKHLTAHDRTVKKNRSDVGKK